VIDVKVSVLRIVDERSGRWAVEFLILSAVCLTLSAACFALFAACLPVFAVRLAVAAGCLALLAVGFMAATG